MQEYFRNHQLYLAEKCIWVDKTVTKTSIRSLMKIQAYKEEIDLEQKRLNLKLVITSLLTPIESHMVLVREGYYISNIHN